MSKLPRGPWWGHQLEVTSLLKRYREIERSDKEKAAALMERASKLLKKAAP